MNTLTRNIQINWTESGTWVVIAALFAWIILTKGIFNLRTRQRFDSIKYINYDKKNCDCGNESYAHKMIRNFNYRPWLYHELILIFQLSKIARQTNDECSPTWAVYMKTIIVIVFSFNGSNREVTCNFSCARGTSAFLFVVLYLVMSCLKQTGYESMHVSMHIHSEIIHHAKRIHWDYSCPILVHGAQHAVDTIKPIRLNLWKLVASDGASFQWLRWFIHRWIN